jgi:stage IV sporulation protein A
LAAKDGAFYRALGEECDVEIADDLAMLKLMKGLCEEQREYAKIKDAFAQAKECGYGAVAPKVADLTLEKPTLVRRGANYGVRFGAKGESYHILKVEVCGESAPIVGGKEQGESFLKEVLLGYGEEPTAVLETNIFGRSLKELLETEIVRKTESVPPTLRAKLSRTLGKMVNEGKGGFFCILL